MKSAELILSDFTIVFISSAVLNFPCDDLQSLISKTCIHMQKVCRVLSIGKHYCASVGEPAVSTLGRSVVLVVLALIQYLLRNDHVISEQACQQR